MVELNTRTPQHRTRRQYANQMEVNPNVGLVPEKHLALTSEYAIQDALKRYELGDPSLKVNFMPLEDDNDMLLKLW